MQEPHVTEDLAREGHDRDLAPDADEVAASAEVGPIDGPASEVREDDPADDPVESPVTDAAGAAPDLHPEELISEDPRSKEELLAELAEAESRRDEYLDDLRRARAEFENFRKRTLRESGTQREAGKADAVGGLLEVLDDLDRTVEAAEGTADGSLGKGITLVAEKLVRSLQALGLERIDRTGVVFDPNVHEAVQQRPSEQGHDEPVVAEVFRPGYRLGERVLRPAMVIVEQ
jgi:molecular chaperone GrpE